MKDFRKTTGMNQQEFADHFGVPVRTIQEWEQGRRNPPEYVFNMMKRIWILENIIKIEEKHFKEV